MAIAWVSEWCFGGHVTVGNWTERLVTGPASVLRRPQDGSHPHVRTWILAVAHIYSERAVCATSFLAAPSPVWPQPSANPRCSPAGPRPIRKGEVVSMDYAPEKLDGPVLLDYGVMDTSSPKVGAWAWVTMGDCAGADDDGVG